jgi:hypothetical protein
MLQGVNNNVAVSTEDLNELCNTLMRGERVDYSEGEGTL